MLFNLRIPAHRAAAALLAVGISSFAAVQAFDPPPPPPDAAVAPQRYHHGLPPELAALNLSDAQKAQIKALHQAGKAQHQQQHAAGKALHQSLRKLSPGAPNYTQEVDRIATQMGQAFAQHVRDAAAMHAQVWALLTPLQQSQLAAMPPPEPGHRRHMHHDE